MSAMNHFKRVSNRVSWYELKRLQSSLSVANSKIQIPARIKRSSTDVLSAIEATIPDVPHISYAYQDDPYLIPIKKRDYRLYMLAYESGKKAAMWIHDDHRELFPKHLSEPEIEAFKPPEKYTDKSQVSEEILLNLISRQKLSDAIHVYRLLEGEVSNDAKQMLLELLCFFDNRNIYLSNDISFERWFHDEKITQHLWQDHEDRTELYNFLIKQDAATAAAAHNIMICGLVRFSRDTEALALYERCKEADIPLNVTTYNYVFKSISLMHFQDDKQRITLTLDILKSMNEKGVKPNVRTLNAALKFVSGVEGPTTFANVQMLIAEFKRIGVECSLASYYYALLAINSKDTKFCQKFEKILSKVNVQSYKIRDRNDGKFLSHGMFLAQLHSNRKAGDHIHNIFLTGDNYKLLFNSTLEDSYYSWYLLLMLSTSKVEEFFKIYDRYVPALCTPRKRVYQYIIDKLQLHEPTIVVKYIVKLWRDINTLNYTEVSLKIAVIRLMRCDLLPADSPLKTEFANAAWNFWNEIKNFETQEKKHAPIKSGTTASLAIMLLHVGHVKEAETILAATAKELDFILPTMSRQQLDELFEACLTERSVAGALSVLEYSENAGFPHVAEMARKLNNQLELTSDDRDKLINLVGAKVLCAPNASKSS